MLQESDCLVFKVRSTAQEFASASTSFQINTIGRVILHKDLLQTRKDLSSAFLLHVPQTQKHLSWGKWLCLVDSGLFFIARLAMTEYYYFSTFLCPYTFLSFEMGGM